MSILESTRKMTTNEKMCYDMGYAQGKQDAVPVVRGEWVEAKSGVMSVWPPGQVMCSVCGQRMPSQWKKMPQYCYGCGAKMEGGGEA